MVVLNSSICEVIPNFRSKISCTQVVCRNEHSKPPFADKTFIVVVMSETITNIFNFNRMPLSFFTGYIVGSILVTRIREQLRRCFNLVGCLNFSTLQKTFTYVLPRTPRFSETTLIGLR